MAFSSTYSMAAQEASVEDLFLQNCGSCHLEPVDETIPGMDVLNGLDPSAIVSAMNDGAMRIQAQPLSQAQREDIAEYISGSAYVATSNTPAIGLCTDALEIDMNNAATGWNGWGSDSSNSRFRAEETSISPSQVAGLRLKWAFGIANATQSRSQPAIIDGILFMASQTGLVHALDAKTGCTYWNFQADAGIRTAISVATIFDEVPDSSESATDEEPPVAPSRTAIFFTDAQTVVYAVDAVSGELLWTTKLDDHPAAAASGALTYHDGVLYAPVSGVSEESVSSSPNYECCTFRGSITALNANTGESLWKTYTVDEPQPRGTNADGVPLWGPAGVAVWSSPTIDEKRGLIYIATGNAYADPPPATSDSIVALSLESGEIRWVNQVLNDVWIMGCNAENASNNPGGNPNCPGEVGPDFDFSASPVLTTLPDGRDILIATQKSGMGFALDPDQEGAVIWDYRWGDGSPAGGVWGAAIDERHAYFAVADMFSPVPGGLKAVELATGREVWSSPPQDPLCGGGQGCNAAQGAAVTTVPGLVFSGANDGGMRAYSADTGDVLWLYDTARDYETVNGVAATGGSIDGPGPIIVDGMLYITSGNGGFFGTAGNVLLAFELEE
jgi:polyvinyl alcohol dehydrogenase (cytochrome)